MKTAFVFLALVAVASAHVMVDPISVKDSDLIHDDQLVLSINVDPASTWVAGHNERFENMTVADVKPMLGAILAEDNETPILRHTLLGDSAIPTSFDARKQWGNKIHPIRDQQKCGSCWAFSASEVLSDRIAIASDGKTDVILSPEDMVSCDKTDHGCQGGMLSSAWNYLKSTGIVTDKCFPYTAGAGTPATCETKCVDGEAFTKYKSTDAFQMRTVADMQKEIMTNGPIQVGFKVYKSFMSYKSGVYAKKWYEVMPMGGHAVKIVGWGVDNGTPYWTVANSWNTTWGMDGFFNIKRGSNECGIESQAYAGHAAAAQSFEGSFTFTA